MKIKFIVYEIISKISGTVKGGFMENFEIVDIDLSIEEVLLRDSSGNDHPIDLRGNYLEMAKKWQNGQRIKANLVYTRSRYTPGTVLAFFGNIEVLE